MTLKYKIQLTRQTLAALIARQKKPSTHLQTLIGFGGRRQWKDSETMKTSGFADYAHYRIKTTRKLPNNQ